ncbi:hypothetical protein [Roseobacter sinensis]|uniref:Uncharacterized protein n=1 Tax=Roseobacter sinensis TaxID=2931391 RepID=A0ABT3BKR4_9RHOB|nr:hypothetical protein [Roseobacter sp. WL0113]MCV3274165.1 hypothetical protein [Roseobacter sp. WL0113]
MDDTLTKSVVVFDRPFKMPGFDQTLPAGEYDIETELASPPDHRDPEAWKASVMIHLPPRVSHPGLKRSLLVSLMDFDKVCARDKLTGKQVSEVFFEEMLADPMVQLVMRADGVSEAQLRHLYSGQRTTQTDPDLPDPKSDNNRPLAPSG